MPLTPGTRLGPYEIVSALGAGGMGEVYKARDTRLDRTVAIKVLPEHVASDPDLKQRFEREAKTISSLNHPHICTLHDVGSQDGIDFLVMEHLEGETLARRLGGGALPLDQALQAAIQIADALDKAHRQGITHRDLKPGNIMLTKTGAKLLDFGLAKLRPGGAVDSVGLSEAPTLSSPLTGAGTILGTFQYMAPEQLEGQEADARTDIFAFGAVVYEMVTGRKAFEGKSQASLIAAIMHMEPQPMVALEAMTPRALDHIVKRSLAKDPDDRWQTAGDLMREIRWVAEGGAESQDPADGGTAQSGSWPRLAWVGLALVTLIAVALGALAVRAGPQPPTMSVVDIATAASPSPLDFAISPDGTKIVFVAYDGGISKLLLRRLNSLGAEAEPLAGTENPRNPFWSADSRHIGFQVDENKLMRVDIDTGTVQTVAPSNFGHGTWNNDGTILYSLNGMLFRVSDTGTEPPTQLALDTPGPATAPHFLPDGDSFLFYVSGSEGGVYRGQLGASETSHVLDADAVAVFVGSNTLLFVREGTLFAQEFDPTEMTLGGTATPVANGVLTYDFRGVSGSTTGAVVYRSAASVLLSEFLWVSRSGTQGERFVVMTGFDAAALELSPDEREVVFEQTSTVNGTTSIWKLELDRGGITTPLTASPGVDAQPSWSPDGSQVAFFRVTFDPPNLFVTDSAPGSNIVSVLEGPEEDLLNDWSPDGRYLLFSRQGDRGDLWAFDMNGDEGAFAVVASDAHEYFAQFSPDGHWIAYESDELGERNIYVQPFPGPGSSTQVSRDGGAQVRWALDGDELFYISLDGEFMSVPVVLPPEGEPRCG